MRGRQAELADILGAVFFAHATEVFRFLQDAPRDRQHRLAGLGKLRDALAVAQKNLYAQLFFQQADLFADTRLRREQAFRCIGNVEAVIDHGAQITHLLQIHT